MKGNQPCTEVMLLRALTEPEERLVFLSLERPDDLSYLLPYAVRVCGDVTASDLCRALTKVSARHEQLRVRLRVRSGTIVAEVLDSCPEVEVVELCTPLGNRGAISERLAVANAAQPLPVLDNPLWSARIVSFAPDDHLLLLRFHHAAIDGWSLDLFWTELRRTVAGELPEHEVLDFSSYAEWLAREADSPSQQRAWEWWSSRLSGYSGFLDLPLDYPRRPRRGRGDALRFRIDGEDLNRLQNVAQAKRTSLPGVLLSAFQVLIHRLTGSNDVAVAVPTSGRTRPEVEDVIGPFTTTCIVRSTVDHTTRIDDVVGSVGHELIEVLDRQHVPLAALISEMAVERPDDREPFMQAGFNFDTTAPVSVTETRIDWTEVPTLDMSARLELSLVCRHYGQIVDCSMEYDTDLFSRDSVELYVEYLREIVHAIAWDGAQSGVWELPLGHDSVADGGPTDDLGSDLLAPIVAQAIVVPDHTAVEWGDSTLSYAELIGLAGGIARDLKTAGVAPGDRVGMLCQRDLALLPTILGILMARASYVPLDPEAPISRLSYQIIDAGITHVVASLNLRNRLKTLNVDVVTNAVVAPAPMSEVVSMRATDVEDSLEPEAYILYTSGSTGQPKGVSVSQRAVLGMVAGTFARFGVACLRRSLASVAITFDASAAEIFPALCAGGTVLVAESALEAADYVGQRTPTFVVTVPSVISAALDSGGVCLEGVTVAIGGEPLTGRLTARLHQAGAARVLNVYGPTEDTTYCTCEDVEVGQPFPTIGRPLPGRRCAVVDQQLRPVPVGVWGILALGGVGVANGYVGDPGRTASVFVPESNSTGTRLFVTGDEVRMRPDGKLEIRGRIDDQVKINGLRIELGEIGNALSEIEGVRAGTALVDRRGTNPRIIGVVEVESALERPWREQLANRLPRSLIPAALVQVRHFPRRPSGKLDNEAVLTLADSEIESRASVARPPTAVAMTIRQAMARLLNRESMGVADDFFRSGGNSLTALRLVVTLREQLGVALDIADIFTNPTAELLADSICEPEILTSATERELTREEFRLWYLDQASGAGSAYNIPLGYLIRGPVDTRALSRAYQWVLSRHEALRTRYRETPEGPVAFVADPGSLAFVNMPLETATDQQMTDLVTALGKQPFMLSQGPLVRAVLYIFNPELSLLAMCFHHIVTDGWSVSLIESDLGTAYRKFTLGHEPEAGASTASPVAGRELHVASKDGLDTSGMTFWRELLSGYPLEPILSFDHHRPKVPTYHGRAVSKDLPSVVTRLILDVAAQKRTSPFVVGLALFGLAVLKFANGAHRILLGAPFSGRLDERDERTVGMFVNMLPFPINASGNPSFLDYIDRIRDSVYEVLDHANTPLDLIIRAAGGYRSQSWNPLFQIAFAFEGETESAFKLDGVSVSVVNASTTTAKFDLTANLHVDDKSGAMSIEYATDVFEKETVDKLIDAFIQVAAAVQADPWIYVQHLIGPSVDVVPSTSRHRDNEELDSLPEPTRTTHARVDTEIKATLQELWSLSLDRSVGVVPADEDYFAVGGSSLSALALLARINRELGVRISVRELFNNPTFEAILDRVAAGSSRNTVTSGGARQEPLAVLVPPIDSSPLIYSGLVTQLNQSVEISALDGSRVSTSLISSLPALVEYYVEELDIAQTRRPLLLVGWSAGGPIAFELASRLSVSHRPIRIALLDVDELPCEHPDYQRLDEQECLQALESDYLRSPYLGHTGVSERTVAGLRALIRYRPERHEVPGRYVLSVDGKADRRAAAWSHRCGGLRVDRVPAGHYDIIKGPFAAIVTALLEEDVNMLRASEPS